MSDDGGDDYGVGYCRPPKHTQFQKGQSGNPEGRPKSKKSGQTDISELINEPVKVKAAGKARDMQPFEASVRQLAKKALGGDLRAMVRFLKLCEEYGAIAAPTTDMGGGVILAPRGVDFQEWLESVTEPVPVDETESAAYWSD